MLFGGARDAATAHNGRCQAALARGGDTKLPYGAQKLPQHTLLRSCLPPHPTPFKQVYECAADVCARAGDFPEALKALQQLVHLIYPALASQEAALADAEEHGAAGQPAAAAVAAPAPAGPPGLSLHGRVAAGSNGSWSAGPAAAAAALQRPQPAAAVAGWVEDGDAEDEAWADAAAGAAALCDASLLAALQRRAFRRWPEVAAALSLYFACVQQGPGSDRLDTLATLRRLPHLLLAMPEVQTALRLRRALAAGDFVALFRQRPTAPRLVQLVVDAAVVQARERALGVIAAAYRNIATAAVCRMLALDSRQLLACLKVLADRWVLTGSMWVLKLEMKER